MSKPSKPGSTTPPQNLLLPPAAHELLEIATWSNWHSLGNATSGKLVIHASGEAICYVLVSTDGSTWTQYLPPILYKGNTDINLTNLVANTHFCVRYVGGVGTVRIEAIPTP